MKNKYGVLIKSDRAIEAESSGKRVFSKLKAWQKRAVKKGMVRPCEWHHTSGAANCTYYYRLEDFEKLDPKDFPPVKVEKQEQADLKRLKIEITFEEMTGGFTKRARKKFETITVEGLDVRKKDNVITGAGGRRLTSNNKSIKYFYKKQKAKKFVEITKEEAEALGYKFI